MEKPGKIRVTKKQAEQLVEHLQQYVRAAELRRKDPEAWIPEKTCYYCDTFEFCLQCPLSKERQRKYCDWDVGYINHAWIELRDIGSEDRTPVAHDKILARAQVLQERTNKWIYPWQIEDLSKVVKKEEGK